MINAAPIEVTIGGKPYKMSPLTGRDIAELSNWVKSQLLKQATEAAEGMSDAQADRLIATACREAQAVDWHTSKLMGTPIGIARVIWQGVQHHHDVSFGDFIDIMYNPKELRSARAAFDLVNENPTQPPTTKGRKQRKRKLRRS